MGTKFEVNTTDYKEKLVRTALEAHTNPLPARPAVLTEHGLQ